MNVTVIGLALGTQVGMAGPQSLFFASATVGTAAAALAPLAWGGLAVVAGALLVLTVAAGCSRRRSPGPGTPGPGFVYTELDEAA